MWQASWQATGMEAGEPGMMYEAVLGDVCLRLLTRGPAHAGWPILDLLDPPHESA